MLPREDRLAAPHTPRPRYGLAAPRTSFNEVAAHRQVLNPRRRGRPAARGAFERRGQARRLTCAWSWRAPCVVVELRLCATPHPKPAGAGAPARIAPAAQARSVRRLRIRMRLNRPAALVVAVLTLAP